MGTPLTEQQLRDFSAVIANLVRNAGYVVTVEYNVELHRLNAPNVRIVSHTPGAEGPVVPPGGAWISTELTVWYNPTIYSPSYVANDVISRLRWMADPRKVLDDAIAPLPVTQTSGKSAAAGANDRVVVTASSGVPTTAVSILTEKTPASGTLSSVGVQSDEIQRVIESLGYDPAGSYNGYEWDYFYKRSQLYSGIVVGPAELGLSESDRINLSEFTRRYAAYNKTGSHALMDQQDYVAGTGSVQHQAGKGDIIKALWAMIVAMLTGRKI